MDFDLEGGMRELADDASRVTHLPVETLGRRLRQRRTARTATVAVVGVAASVGLVAGAAAIMGQFQRSDVVAPEPTADATRVPTATPRPTETPAPPSTPEPAVTSDPASTVPPEPSPPALPRPSDEVHGSTAWAVYVAVSPVWDDPALTEADSRLTAMGYTKLRGGELACDRGAAEALGRSPDEAAIAVYFDTQADASRFVELYGDGVVGTVEVTLYCRD